MTWQDSGGQTPPGGPDDDATRPDWDPTQPAVAPPSATQPVRRRPERGLPRSSRRRRRPPGPQHAAAGGSTARYGHRVDRPDPRTRRIPRTRGYPAPAGAWSRRPTPGTASRRGPSTTRVPLPRFLAYWLDGILIGIIAGLFGGIAGAGGRRFPVRRR